MLSEASCSVRPSLSATLCKLSLFPSEAFPPARGQKWLLERLDAQDDTKRTVSYSGINYGAWSGEEAYPLSASVFPGSFIDYTSTIVITEVTAPSSPPSAFIEWSGEVWTEPANAAEMKGFLDAFYSGNLQTLNAHFAAR